MKILLLTDHQGHHKTNSFYGIANALLNHVQIEQVWVASRSWIENTSFFKGEGCAYVHTGRLQGGIEYSKFQDSVGEVLLKKIDFFDFILLRVPYPLHSMFLDALCKVFPQNKIVNDPAGIKKVSNKSFLLQLDQYVPPMHLCNSIEDLEWFSSQFSIVLKPLESYGGKGIVKLEGEHAYFEDKKVVSKKSFYAFFEKNKMPYLGMKFLANVKNGDKRIIVINGKLIGASVRKPMENSWICNVSQNGESFGADVTKMDEDIVQYLNPYMKSNGIFLYGVDLLEGDDNEPLISEINALSVGGLLSLQDQTNLPVFDVFAEEFVVYCKSIY